MSAMQAVHGGIESVKQSNVLIQEAQQAIRAAIASIVQAKKVSGEQAASAFAQAASMVSSNTSSRGHVLANRARNRAQLLEEIQMKLVAVLDPASVMLVRGAELINDAEQYQRELAR